MTTSEPKRRGSDGTTALLSIALDRGSHEPLSRQLYHHIGEAILTGRLAAGARLPSTRTLSEDLKVSRTVPLAAYDQLTMEGYIEARRGSGQYVMRLGGLGAAPSRRDVRRGEPGGAVIEFPPRGRPFDPVSQVAGTFPHNAWARLLGRGWRLEGQVAASQDDWAGVPSLRAAIARHLNVLRGIECTADQILITSGNADALQLIVQALAPSEKERDAGVWVENPGHMESRSALSREGMRLVPVPVDEGGLDVAAGCRLAKQARLALVTPSRQFPLGMPLSLSRRIALVAWARENGAVLIEDDYDTEMRFSGRPIPSLLSLDRDQAALSLGSLSKLTFPGLRLGYIVGPGRLISRLAGARARSGALLATTAQPALAGFIVEGGFARHLRGLRREIAQRRAALIAALRSHLGTWVTILPQEVGMHLTVTLKHSRMRDSDIAALAADHSLTLDPLSGHATGISRPQGFLLGYAGWDAELLVSRVEALAELLAENHIFRQ